MKDILNNIIRSRRSVFPVQYNGEVIDDNIVNEIFVISFYTLFIAG